MLLWKTFDVFLVYCHAIGNHQLGLFALQSAEEFLCQEKQEFGNLVKLLGRHFSNGNCVIFLNLLKFRSIKWFLSMSMAAMTASINNVTDLLQMIESNEAEKWHEIKHLIYESYHEIKDSWLVQMLYDLHSHSGSSRCLELLLNVREPHEKFLLDKIAEGEWTFDLFLYKISCIFSIKVSN